MIMYGYYIEMKAHYDWKN